MHADADYAWAAGFLDGEGTLRIAPNGNTFIARISAPNTDPRPLYRLQEMFGGVVKLSKRGSKFSDKWRDVYRYRTHAQGLLEMVVALRPYFLVKDKHADIMIQFLSLPERTPKNRPYTDEEFTVRFKLMLEINDLNKRGRISADEAEEEEEI